MNPILLAALAGVGVLGTWKVISSKSNDFPDVSPVGHFPGALNKGGFYRVWARVNPSYMQKVRGSFPGKDQQQQLSADLSKWLEKTGFSPVILAIQDPSESQVWSFLAYWSLSSREAFDAGPLRLYQVQAVDEPPVTMVPPAEVPEKLDSGLLLDEIMAIQYALAKDVDPKHLTGFASVLSPEFPVAASLLRAKGYLVQANSSSVAVSGVGDSPRRAYETASAVVGFLDVYDWVRKPRVSVGNIFDDVGDTLSDAVDTLKDLTSDLGDTVQNMWQDYGGIVETLGGFVPGPQLWAIETAYKLADAINKGEAPGDAFVDTMSEQGARFAHGLQQVSPFVAMIPGLGTGVAMMLNSAAALALAQPLDQAALDTIALAVPGGPMAQQGFRTAANFGNAMLRGESLDEAAIEAARKTFKDQFGDEAAVAFDAGLALARGKSLQETGFQALYSLAKGNSLAEKAANFANTVTKAVGMGGNTKSLLIQELKNSIDKYGPSGLDQLGKAVDEVQRNGDLLKMFPNELAAKLGINEDIARAAQAAVKEIASGVRIVDPAVMNTLRPFANVVQSTKPQYSIQEIKTIKPDLSFSNFQREAYALKPATVTVSATTSPSALKLVEATRRPEMSLVVDPSKIVGRVDEVNKAASNGDPEALQAKEALAKASRELERRKWVEWYKRQAEIDPIGTL